MSWAASSSKDAEMPEKSSRKQKEKLTLIEENSTRASSGASWDSEELRVALGIEYIAIEVTEEDKALAKSIKRKCDDIILPSESFGSQCSIYRVHEKFRKINKYAYTPEMVSIGPFHHGNKSLSAMEKHKHIYLNEYLSRTNADLDKYVTVIRRLEDKARKCYSEPFNLNSNEFVEMMLIDGLFIIELFQKHAEEVRVGIEDPIFSNLWILNSLLRDTVLLENQLPMFVLESLFRLWMSETTDAVRIQSLRVNVCRFFNPLMPREKPSIEVELPSINQSKHLLDLYADSFKVASHPLGKRLANRWKFMPSVSKLRRAGVKFNIDNHENSFLHVHFDSRSGILYMSRVTIGEQTDTLLRNLIASEQCYDGYDTCMTSYAFLMDSLIKSPEDEDVGILRKAGIIINSLGKDEDVYALFNKLCREVTLVNFCYSQLCNSVNDYYKTNWRFYRAFWWETLKRNYFKNPWIIISAFAGLIIISLTLIQAMFAVLSFSLHKS